MLLLAVIVVTVDLHVVEHLYCLKRNRAVYLAGPTPRILWATRLVSYVKHSPVSTNRYQMCQGSKPSLLFFAFARRPLNLSEGDGSVENFEGRSFYQRGVLLHVLPEGTNQKGAVSPPHPA